jgi:hypothetical protein
MWGERERRMAPWAGAALLFLIFFLYSPQPDPRIRLCPFYWLTSRPCPLCGLTRAFCSLAKGRWRDAIHLHALSPVAFALVFSLFWKFRWKAMVWTAGMVLIAVYGVWRAATAS